ncbi:hypothetical protein GOZ78_13720 [Agrobacterium vitis]|uniref:Uncharacterized protein n=1 Tax=Agrobacterium vitis TaxID=373 RepID=A0ABD6GE49_AGRVI|nr:hypothetical protein [Agrobacterium vitis]MUO79924.1 hypothetical protein [Agrobacterium vitis]MUO93587.1 hypothetical protein [Agrobacterium vitis]MUP04162.1 hypothetical protein [Agrobacterium vitis]MUZ84354.1 hypothetical protein [Agrobacterium vitis]MVA11085.1 hypothetical protein [Agrobacterium vitis]
MQQIENRYSSLECRRQTQAVVTSPRNGGDNGKDGGSGKRVSGSVQKNENDF